jgi:hypothetical protein
VRGGARRRVAAGVRRDGVPGHGTRVLEGETREGRELELTDGSRGGEEAGTGVATKTGGDFDGGLGEKAFPGAFLECDGSASTVKPCATERRG